MMIRAAGPVLLGALLLAVLPAGKLEAQQGTAHQQVISANPFGLLLEFFNAEYERVVGQTTTAGVGGSYFATEGDDYLNADVFWRYYPQGRPLDGWAFGAKAGVTQVDSNSYAGFGFDVNRSWLLGANDNFYVGVGFGLKRLLGVSGDADFDLRFIPTIRIVNVGFAF